MAANPITYTEIEAFCRLTRTDLTAWQVDLLCRVDTAVLAAVEQKTARTRKAKEQGPIPVSEVGAIAALLRGLGARKAAEKQSPTTPTPGRRTP